MSNEADSEYDLEQISAFYLELERLLKQVEDAVTYYQVLDLDYLATTGEIRLAYMRAMALLNPSYYGIEVPLTQDMLPRIDQAFEKVSQAFSTLVNFNKRVEYDNLLFRREGEAAKVTPPQPAEPGPAGSERRAHQRFQVAIPVRVTGHDQKSGKWLAMTQTVDISRTGVLLRLGQNVRLGMILHLTMPMPLVLRDHGYFDLSYSMYAVVRRLGPSENQTRLVGLEFIGEQPPGAYFDRPWAVFQVEKKWVGDDRRRHPRRRQSVVVGIEYFSQALDYLSREWAFTEDVSRSGMRVCVKVPPPEVKMVRVFSTDDTFNSFADIVSRYEGRDGFHRLCLQFIDSEWPDN